jgi:DNA polymerase I
METVVNLVLDIETDSKHSKIWMCYTHNSETGQYVCHTEPATLIPLINKADRLIGHNLIGFDAPVLNKLWGTKIGLKKVRDTLIMSRLLNPSIENGHSLAAWGKRLGNNKVEYTRIWHWMKGVQFDKKSMAPYDDPIDNLNRVYCKQDVTVTVELYKYLDEQLEDWGESVQLEHDVAAILHKQERHGFKFDETKGRVLLAQLSSEVADIEGELQATFPPIVEKRVSEKTGKALKDRVTPFNAGSRQQIAERLATLGVKFTQETEKGSTIVNEKVLEGVELPEAKLIARYLMLQKRISQVSSWFEAVQADGRVRGRVITNGAITGRMSHHSPNMAQVPSSSSEYGTECRELWTVDAGKRLVGTDASGIELRMLAHYMQDARYIKTVCEGKQEDGTDVHTMNMKAAGLTSRNQAKTFIYAFLYGAGAGKIGSIIGGSSTEGHHLMTRFLRNTPALEYLKDEVVIPASKKGWLRGLDGRHIMVRSEHAALNSLLQGAGAIIMKKALVILHERLKRGIIQAHFVANVHDEWQKEVAEEDAERVGKMAVQAIEDAGKHFNLRCPLTGEYNVGFNWKDTH